MAVQHRLADATVECSIRVARDDGAGLVDATEAAIVGLDRVEGVDAVRVAGISPRLNDVVVDAEADVTVALAGDGTSTDAAIRDALEGAVGVTVDAVRIDE